MLARVVESRGAHALVCEEFDDERAAQVQQHARELVLVGGRGRQHHGLRQAGVNVEKAQEDAEEHGVVGGRGGDLELACLQRLGAAEHHGLDDGERLAHESAHELGVLAVKRALDEVVRVAAARGGFGHKLCVQYYCSDGLAHRSLICRSVHMYVSTQVHTWVHLHACVWVGLGMFPGMWPVSCR